MSLERRISKLESAAGIDPLSLYGPAVREAIAARIRGEDCTATLCSLWGCDVAEVRRREELWYAAWPPELRSNYEHAVQSGRLVEVDAPPTHNVI